MRQALTITRVSHFGLASALLLFAAVYGESVARLVRTWYSSRNYAHCWLVLPVVAWLIWRQRANWLLIAPRPSLLGLSALIATSVIWLASMEMQVNVGEQFALVGIAVSVVWAVWGTARFRALLFPLAFLFFAVPFGDELVPALMEWTATATVTLLRWSGFEVHREGMFFATTVGDFAVAEACSGVRYLMASASAGALFAHLALQRNVHRWVLFGVAVLAPIVANAIRAYLIVVIAHLSDLKLAVGVDHAIYGTVFFAILMILVFWSGDVLRRRDRAETVTSPGPSVSGDRAPTLFSFGSYWLATLALLLVTPLLASARAPRPISAATLAIPTALPDWGAPQPSRLAWRPVLAPESQVLRADYAHPRLGRVTVAVIEAGEAGNANGSMQLTGRTQFLANPDQWMLSAARTVDGGANTPSWREAAYSAQTTDRKLTMRSSYLLDSRLIANRYEVTLRALWERLRGRPGTVRLLVFVRADAAGNDATASLESITQLGEQFRACAAPASRTPPGCTGAF
jgi:exosortase A